jgi:trigger factor
MNLKIETQPRDDHQMKVVAEFDPGTLDKYKHIAARKISQRSKIPGFRPGKAPFDVVVRLYGDKALEGEAIENVVDELYPTVIEEAKIKPGASGSLEEIVSTDPLKLSFIIPLEPTVDLGDYRSVHEEYKVEPASDKEVNDFINRMRRSYATAEPVERAAKKEDLVSVMVDANLTQVAEGENAEVLKNSPLQVVIGEKDPEEDQEDDDFPYPGFGDNLKGLKADDEKTFKYTYPEDSIYDRLRGREVEFHVTVQNVKKLELPELTDEFAQTLGNFENVDKLREIVKNQLSAQKKADYDDDYFERVIAQLVSKANIKYPPQLLQDEMDHAVEHVEEDLADQKLELDVYLKTLKKDKATWLEEEIKPVARKRLERSLLMDEIAKVEKIEVSADDLNQEFNTLLGEMQGQEDFKKLQRRVSTEDLTNAVAVQATTRVLNRRVLDRIKEIASGISSAPEAAIEDAGEIKPKRSRKKKVEAEGTVNEEAAAPVKSEPEAGNEETPKTIDVQVENK